MNRNILGGNMNRIYGYDIVIDGRIVYKSGSYDIR
jgi:hypothetical protein